MSEQDQLFRLDRRSLLQAAILLVGGTAAAPAAWAQPAARFFSPGERALLDVLCDTMIPRTDTPGAVDAGVPGFLDGLMVNWAGADKKAQLRDIVNRLGKAAQDAHGRPLTALSAAERSAFLTSQDAALLRAGDGAYRLFKRLVMTAYYWSEPGATEELRYELVPGVWKPSIPITPETRTWAA